MTSEEAPGVVARARTGMHEAREFSSGAQQRGAMGRIWKAIKWFFDSQMRATVVGAIVLAATLGAYQYVYHRLTEPPGIDTVTGLMQDEAASALAHDTTVVSRIYTPDAIVTDAACQTPGASHSWQGYPQLNDRYSALPRFLSIKHLFAHVSWEPANSHATTASVTAETVGVLGPSTGPVKSQSIVGRELWTFALVDGQWRVTSFTYNLCLPASIGG